jgi:hypothetical protein
MLHGRTQLEQFDRKPRKAVPKNGVPCPNATYLSTPQPTATAAASRCDCSGTAEPCSQRAKTGRKKRLASLPCPITRSTYRPLAGMTTAWPTSSSPSLSSPYGEAHHSPGNPAQYHHRSAARDEKTRARSLGTGAGPKPPLSWAPAPP